MYRNINELLKALFASIFYNPDRNGLPGYIPKSISVNQIPKDPPKFK